MEKDNSWLDAVAEVGNWDLQIAKLIAQSYLSDHIYAKADIYKSIIEANTNKKAQNMPDNPSQD